MRYLKKIEKEREEKKRKLSQVNRRLQGFIFSRTILEKQTVETKNKLSEEQSETTYYCLQISAGRATL